MTSALFEMSILEMLAGLRRADFSSVELAQHAIQRIQALDPQLHSLITFTPELALRQAQAADERYREWREDDPSAWWQLPPLLGIPLVIKDVLALRGIPLTCGSRILEGYVPPYTATAVQKLLDAGVSVLGKTNTDEFAMGSTTESSAFGPSFNPWDTTHVPGGSSGGSAAAVAARLVPVAIGSDTGGSVRQPASFCGVTGFKPTYGRVSRHGLTAYGSSLDCVGVLAASAADVLPLYQVISGHDPLDATSARRPQPEITLSHSATLKGKRIGVPGEYFQAGMLADVERAVRAGLEVLAQLGGELTPINLPHTSYAVPVYYTIASAEASANLARFDGVRYGLREDSHAMWDVFNNTRSAGFGAEVKRRIMLGTYALSAGYYDAYYGQAQKVRAWIRDDFEKAFASVDLIASPATPGTAFPLGKHADDPLSMYLEDVFTLPANLAGLPAIALPCGFDGMNLPVGMQLMAAPFQEEQLFHAAHAYQLATDWHRRRPRLAA